MNRSSSELKGMARESLRGHYSTPVAALLMIQLAVTLITVTYANFFGSGSSLIYYAGLIIISLLTCLAEAGYSWLLMKLARRHPVQPGDIFYPFSHQGDRILITTIMKGLLGLACLLPALAALLFVSLYPGLLWLKLLALFLFLAGIVGSVIVELAYSLTTYICLDVPELTSTEVMKTSRELTEGKRFRLFYLEISFLGLGLLSVLTCYVGLLWLLPYMETAKIHFYRELNGEI
ncbi:MAG: DUF975 family protein [Candidatus Limivivens sp.]|nr:DUF975 family protein [Candidatus Limivivens sp.]